MGVAAAPLMLLGTGLSVAGTIKQGRDAKAIGAFNARTKERVATTQRQRGAAQGAVRVEQTRRFMASQIAEINALGGQVGGATELEIAERSARGAQLDLLNTIYDSEYAAIGLESEAVRDRAEGRAAYSTAILGGLAKAATGLGRFAQAYGQTP